MTDEPAEAQCPACEDSGWIIRQCGGRDRICGRTRAHLPHEWAAPCPCRAMNRRWNEKQGNYVRVA